METTVQNHIKKTYPVKGMSCASCANSVETMLKSQQGVVEAQVNFATNSVLVDFDPTQVSPETMKKSIHEIGFELVTERFSEDKLKSEKKISLKKLRNKLVFAASLALPVFVISMFNISIPFKNWVLLVLTTPVIFWSGRDFYVNAWKKIRHGATNMDTLIALGTGSAYLFSLFNTFSPSVLIDLGITPHVYYESAVVIITLILFGNYLEDNAKDRTSSAIEKLLGLQPNNASVKRNNKIIIIPIDQVVVGDELIIKPGEKVPVDGEVIEGKSYVDESMVTGEPEAVLKEKNAKVIGGTINQNGSFSMNARHVGSETMLSRIIELVKEAQGTKAPAQKLADKISAVFVPVVILIALISFGIWFIVGPGFTTAFVILVTVLIIACPCALGLATPTAITVGIGKGANQGILIKDASALEKVNEIDVLMIDKTGTITKGKPEVTYFGVDPSINQQSLIDKVYALEAKSEHPLAKAILNYLNNRKSDQIVEVDEFENLTGKGISGKVKGKEILIGGLNLWKNDKLFSCDAVEKSFFEVQSSGLTLVFVAEDNKVVAVFGLQDQIKPRAAGYINQLHKQGIEVIMLTGDQKTNAKKIADEVGIDQFHAQILPEEKASYVTKYQALGKTVAMAGDGINDAPALAKADVGIAMGSGSDIAIESAPITLLKGDIGKITKAIKLSLNTKKTIRENLFWAFIYNIIAIPIAAGILYPLNGFLLNPMIAGGAMAFSSVSVVLNSLRLKNRKI